jgi:hypothetical protein
MDVAELVSTVAAGTAAVLNAAQLGGHRVEERHARGDRARGGQIAGRLLYSEVLFNVMALRVGSKLSPPSLLVQDGVYRGLVASGDLKLTSLSDEELAITTTAYAVTRFTAAVFQQEWLPLIGIRLHGGDYQALEALAEKFREAEYALRKAVWNDEQQSRIRAALDEQGALSPILCPDWATRLRNVPGTVPGWIWVGAMALASRDLFRRRTSKS